jgi:hypothetical protein
VPSDRSRTSQPLELALYLVRSASTHGKAEALHYASQRIGSRPLKPDVVRGLQVNQIRSADFQINQIRSSADLQVGLDARQS